MLMLNSGPLLDSFEKRINMAAKQVTFSKEEISNGSDDSFPSKGIWIGQCKC